MSSSSKFFYSLAQTQLWLAAAAGPRSTGRRRTRTASQGPCSTSGATGTREAVRRFKVSLFVEEAQSQAEMLLRSGLKAASARALNPREGLEPWIHNNDLDITEALDLLLELQLPSPAQTPSLSPPASNAPASPPTPAPTPTRFTISNLPVERDLAQKLKVHLEDFTRTGSLRDVQVTEGNLRASAVVAIDLSRVVDPDQALVDFVRSAPFGDKYEVVVVPYVEPSRPPPEPPAGHREGQIFVSGIAARSHANEVLVLIHTRVPFHLVENIRLHPAASPSTSQIAFVTLASTADVDNVLDRLQGFKAQLHHSSLKFSLNRDYQKEATDVPKNYYPPRQPRPQNSSPPNWRSRPQRSRSPGVRPKAVSDAPSKRSESWTRSAAQILIRKISGSTTSLELRRALVVALPARDILDLELENIRRYGSASRTQVGHLTVHSSVDVPYVLRELQAKHLTVNKGQLVFEAIRGRPRTADTDAGVAELSRKPPHQPPAPPRQRSRSPIAAPASSSSGPQLFVSKVNQHATAEELRLIIERVVPPAVIVTVALQPCAEGVAQVAYVTLDSACDVPSVLRDLGALKLTRPRFSANLARDPYLAPTRLESYRPLESLPPGAQLFVSRIHANSTEESLRKALELIVPAQDLVNVALRPAPGEDEGQVAYLTLTTTTDVRRLVRKLEEQPVDLDSSRLSFDVLQANPPPPPATAPRPRSRSPTRHEGRPRYRDPARAPDPRPATSRRRSRERSPPRTRLPARRVCSRGGAGASLLQPRPTREHIMTPAELIQNTTMEPATQSLGVGESGRGRGRALLRGDGSGVRLPSPLLLSDGTLTPKTFQCTTTTRRTSKAASESSQTPQPRRRSSTKGRHRCAPSLLNQPPPQPALESLQSCRFEKLLFSQLTP